MEKLRIVFMGTPEFAVASLRALVESGANVVGVVTMPDKAIGRHHDTLQSSPVKQYAVSQGLPVLQPVRLKDEVFGDELRALRPDLAVVVAFRMLPECVWQLPRLGTINLHAALLPQYRGAAPINWAVINGDRETGVTTFFLKHAIDTGDIIYSRSTPITDDDTAGTVHDRLMGIGAELVVETVCAIAAGTAPQQPQPEVADLRPAPKIFKETCRIDWSQPARSVFNFVRGLSPYPAAWTVIDDGAKHTELKIFRTRLVPPLPGVPVGTVDTTEGFTVALADGALRVEELQAAGRRRMSAADFVRGLHTGGVLRVE
ncbi:MAG: methionyl-tRNA formyltransferase [Bacteroidaceae bacterium]|nr:methionyl-tRNA formyltransferase [Bacteroidaceae bacterium]